MTIETKQIEPKYHIGYRALAKNIGAKILYVKKIDDIVQNRVFEWGLELYNMGETDLKLMKIAHLRGYIGRCTRSQDKLRGFQYLGKSEHIDEVLGPSRSILLHVEVQHVRGKPNGPEIGPHPPNDQGRNTVSTI